jgi:hypothetical protein
MKLRLLLPVIGVLAFPAIEHKVPPRASQIGNMLVLAIPQAQSDPGDRRPR